MSTTIVTDAIPDHSLGHIPDAAAVEAFKRQGFLCCRQVLDADEVARYRAALLEESAAQAAGKRGGTGDNQPFSCQHLNLWQHNQTLRELIVHPRLTAIANRLAGAPLRLFHDHLLTKDAGNTNPTQFHQDAPYWPFSREVEPFSAWIALVDVPFDRGCMSFIPGSHLHTDLEAQNLSDERSLFSKCPELEYEPRISYPLRAGDVTYHYGMTAHRAEGNHTGVDRVAHALIYMGRDATFTGNKKHVLTKAWDLTPGRTFADEDRFPSIPWS